MVLQPEFKLINQWYWMPEFRDVAIDPGYIIDSVNAHGASVKAHQNENVALYVNNAHGTSDTFFAPVITSDVNVIGM